jgi:hypothetical protein
MEMLPFLTGALVVPLLLFVSVPFFLYVYVVVRWRAGGGGEPGLGSYGLVMAFRMLAFLMGAGAIAQLLYCAMSAEEYEEMMRVCWGILFAAGIFLVLHIPLGMVLRPAGDFAPARRIFGGGLLLVAGMITLGALVLLMVTLSQKVPDRPGAEESHSDQLKAAGSWLACFGLVYVASAVVMARAVRDSRGG